VEGKERHAMWHVSLYTGLRRGELLGLRWTDVDLDARSIRVAQQFVAPSHEGHFANPKSKTARRTVEITEATAQVLRAHRARQNADRLTAGSGWQGDLVFSDALGAPLLPRTVSAWFKKDVQVAGVPSATLHDLRHTHASLLLRAGVNPKVVQERLGHSDVTTTLRTYSHVMPGMQRHAATAFAELLG
jgi:integrase